MARGILIGRCFAAVNTVLVLTVLVAAGMIAARVLAGGDTAGRDMAGEREARRDVGAPTVAVRERSVYDAIEIHGLFGPAGRMDERERDPGRGKRPSPDPNPPETQLNLKLWAVTSLSPGSPFAAASIEDTVRRTGRELFRVGDAVVEDVILETIHPRWVTLLNGRKDPPVRERLSMDDTALELLRSGMPSGLANTILPAERVEIDRRALVRELYQDYPTLMTKIKPQLYRNPNGDVIGVSARGIGDVPLARQLGLKEGDVLQTVNNERIDSEAKVLDMFQKYQNAGSFRVGILRNGKRKTITFDLR